MPLKLKGDMIRLESPEAAMHQGPKPLCWPEPCLACCTRPVGPLCYLLTAASLKRQAWW